MRKYVERNLVNVNIKHITNLCDDDYALRHRLEIGKLWDKFIFIKYTKYTKELYENLTVRFHN